MDTDTKILPITMPPITAYQRNTSMLAILHHDEETHDWIYNNFIQIKMSMDDFNKNRAMDYHLNYLFEGMHAFCPWIYTQVIKKSMIQYFNKNMIEFLIHCMDENHYILCIADLFYIEGTHAFGKRKAPHELFIYGYDRKQQVLHVADFTFVDKPGYSFNTVRFDQFERAIAACTAADDYIDYTDSLQLWNYNKAASFRYDRELLVDHLRDYLYSRNSSKKISMKQNVESGAYGLDVIDALKVHNKYTVEHYKLADQRALHIFYDHKRMMSLRLKYLISKQRIHRGDELSERYKLIEEKARLIRQIAIIYNMTNDERIHRIFDLLDEVREREQEALELMIDNVV